MSNTHHIYEENIFKAEEQNSYLRGTQLTSTGNIFLTLRNKNMSTSRTKFLVPQGTKITFTRNKFLELRNKLRPREEQKCTISKEQNHDYSLGQEF
jgi:hypothetical protein